MFVILIEYYDYCKMITLNFFHFLYIYELAFLP